jgi:hypothetical protein
MCQGTTTVKVSYSAKCVEGFFCELRGERLLATQFTRGGACAVDSLRVKSNNPNQAMAIIRTISTAGFGMALISAPIMRTIVAGRG